jgi:hypothetical protein
VRLNPRRRKQRAGSFWRVDWLAEQQQITFQSRWIYRVRQKCDGSGDGFKRRTRLYRGESVLRSQISITAAGDSSNFAPATMALLMGSRS